MKQTHNLILGGIGVALVAGMAATWDRHNAVAQGQAPQAPIFEVDPLWPKPMANHWLLGSAVGLAVDARDNVFVLHLTDSFTARTEIGLAANPPTGDCCRPAPHVLAFDATGNLVANWSPAQGVAWPVSNHGLSIDPQGNLWIAGSGGTDTQIMKFSREGRPLLQAGKPAPAPAAAATGAGPDTAYRALAAAPPAVGRGRGGPPPLPANSSQHRKLWRALRQSPSMPLPVKRSLLMATATAASP